MYDLTFDPEKYEIKTCELGNRSITYRAFEHIVYCANPASKIQTLNIYVPEEYYSGKTINGYSLNTAPIFAPNTVGGYMEGPAMEVGIDRFNHKPNSAFQRIFCRWNRKRKHRKSGETKWTCAGINCRYESGNPLYET